MKKSNKSNNKNSILTFSCTGCGICCKERGYVFFNDDDIKRASKFLEISPLIFINKYLEYEEGYGYYIKVTDDKACTFLDENNRCTINSAKPNQCSTFPYWKEYMDKNGNLISGKFKRACPGVKIKK
ncbi:YkgJ family cysteine cluster protein [Brachyspira intermedia]|uniref:YkgJ family cysteine cluster protein n=1 Tax=Brachyspira intermedia TaxID=84377 RepID=UPI0030075E30